MAFVYILKSLKTNRFYIGSTINFEKRFNKHQLGYVKSTKNGRPWKKLLVQKYNSIKQAKMIEYRLKKLKRKDYIEKIIKDQKINLS